MRLWIALASCLTLGLSAQDHPSAAQLVQDLADDDFRVREKAEKSLLRLGAASLEDLRDAAQSSDPHVAETAARLIQTIERTLRYAAAYTPPDPITRFGKVQVTDLLDAVQAGKPGLLDLSQIPGHLNQELTVDLKDATPFDVLDTVCRSVGSISYQVRGDRIVFTRQLFAPSPSASVEAFGLRVNRLEKFDSDDVPNRVEWDLLLTVDVLPWVKILGKPFVSSVEAIDDGGFKLKRADRILRPGPKRGSEGKQRGMWPDIWTFSTDRIASRLRTLKATVRLYFRGEPVEMRFETATKRQEITAEEFKVVLDKNVYKIKGAAKPNPQDPDLYLLFEPQSDSDDWLIGAAEHLLEESSVILVDREGTETRAEVRLLGNNNRSKVYINGKPKPHLAVAFGLILKGIRPEQIQEIRLRAGGVHRRDVHFDLRFP
jgi:hypothetical protein